MKKSIFASFKFAKLLVFIPVLLFVLGFSVSETQAVYFNGSHGTGSTVVCNNLNPQVTVNWSDVPSAVNYNIRFQTSGAPDLITTNPYFVDSNPVPGVNTYIIQALDPFGFNLDFWSHQTVMAVCATIQAGTSSSGPWVNGPLNLSTGDILYFNLNQTVPTPSAYGNMAFCTSTPPISGTFVPNVPGAINSSHPHYPATAGTNYTVSCDRGASYPAADRYATDIITVFGAAAAPVPPSPPSGLTAAQGACGSGTINVSWNSVLDASQYEIRDGLTSIVYSGISTSFPHIGLAAGSTHSYYARVTTPDGTSGWTPVSPLATTTAPSPCAPGPFNVTATAGPNGSISPASRTGVPSGSTVTFTVAPNTGHTASVSGCGGTLAGTTYTTGPITANCSVSATFTPNTYTVTATAGANGTITPGTRSVTHGNTTTFTVTANPTYTASVSSTCGTGSLVGTTYTTAPITGNCSVTASFTGGPGTIPTIDTPTSLAGALTTATIGATVRTLGTPATLIERGVCYVPSPSINPSLTNGATCIPATLSQSVPGTFTVNISGLSPSQSYHYRGYATNATGTGYTADANFTAGTSSTTGTLTPASTTCNINSGSSTCAINFTWNTVNPVVGVTSAVTSNTNNSGVSSPNFTVANGNSGGPAAFTVPYGSRTFYLYHNGSQLDVPRTVSASCSSGSGWTGTLCIAHTVTATAGANGTISPASRSVAHGATTTFTVTPNPGYSASVSGCNGGPTSLQSSSFTYTTGPINSNCTVTASFSPSSMSGTLLPATSTCTIPLGSSSCTSSLLTWTTTGPVGTSSITNNGTAVLATGGPLNTNNGSATFTVPYNNAMSGVTTFYLYNNAVELANATVTSQCTGGTGWNGSVCAASSVPTVTSPTATSPTSSGATLGANVTSAGSPATILERGTCWGSSPAPVTNCQAEGGTSTGVFAHARSGMAASTTYYSRGYARNATGTGYSTDTSFTTATSTGMSGSLSVVECTVPVNSSRCRVDLNWTTTNPVATSAVTSNKDNSDVLTPNYLIQNGNSGSNVPARNYAGSPSGTRSFYLYNNAILLDTVTATTTCEAGSFWNGTMCVAGGPLSPSVTLVATPASIVLPATSTLTWSSSNTDSCSSPDFATGGATSGSVVINPLVTTSYTIDCLQISTSTQVSDVETVTVGAAGSKTPIYIEN